MSPSNSVSTGRHAREAVRECFRRNGPVTADQILRYLEEHDLIIVPRPYTKPARRGNDAALSPLIGKSHTASLVGGAS